MDGKELKEAIAEKFSVEIGGNLHKTINRAIRTLPGGNETLDALETLNAARNHASRHRATERVTAIDAAIDRVEEIRQSMERYVIEQASERYHA
jgi:hypothetical protein